MSSCSCNDNGTIVVSDAERTVVVPGLTFGVVALGLFLIIVARIVGHTVPVVDVGLFIVGVAVLIYIVAAMIMSLAAPIVGVLIHLSLVSVLVPVLASGTCRWCCYAYHYYG